MQCDYRIRYGAKAFYVIRNYKNSLNEDITYTVATGSAKNVMKNKHLNSINPLYYIEYRVYRVFQVQPEA